MKCYLWALLCALLALSACRRIDIIGPTHPVPPEVPGLAIRQVDSIVAGFMQRYNVPGMSVAITRNGKLIYARGYGYADKENLIRTSNNSLFRLASVSKTVTSIAIMRLMEAGKLSLDDKVFGAGAILGTRYGPYTPAQQTITVRHLLQHTAGWVVHNSDPMFEQTALSADALISWTLPRYPLEFAPGQGYSYSNFGYCVLGRIIEKISGEAYETFVKKVVLEPAGIRNMRVGGNTLAERKTNEVRYYGQQGEDPYIYNISRMDSHGGWIASAVDLARLLVSVDGFTTRPDLLSPATIKAMITPSVPNPGYACGWAVNTADNWWHNGSLPGTSTEMVRAANGFNWVLLCNTRNLDNTLYGELDALMWKAIQDPATQWPVKDLFQ